MVRYLFYTIGDLTYQSPLVQHLHVFDIKVGNTLWDASKPNTTLSTYGLGRFMEDNEASISPSRQWLPVEWPGGITQSTQCLPRLVDRDSVLRKHRDQIWGSYGILSSECCCVES